LLSSALIYQQEDVLTELLTLVDVDCRYDGRPAVDGLAMHVTEGNLVSLLGPSGCGKTTVLRAIAGFHPLAAGKILISGREVSRPGFTLAPEKRRLGMVFQDYALFPHLDVADNVGFGLRGTGNSEKRTAIMDLLDRVGLGGMEKRYPHELSGGQQQRVALARALAPKPDLILMDEPFSDLDIELRERLSVEVRDVLKQQGTTAVLVTHDQNEAFALADKVGVMHEGRILQWDTPYNLPTPGARTRLSRFCFVPTISYPTQTARLERRSPKRRSRGLRFYTPCYCQAAAKYFPCFQAMPMPQWVPRLAFACNRITWLCFHARQVPD
jgi:ABC-type Fe3+/spermidine/putrescine transport system ATPase subunit